MAYLALPWGHLGDAISQRILTKRGLETPWGHHLLENPYQMGSGDTLGTPWGHHVLENPYQMGSGGTGGRAQGILISKRLPKQIVGIPHNKSIIWGQVLRGTGSGDTHGVTWGHHLLETPYQLGSGDTLGTLWGHHVLENPYQTGSGDILGTPLLKEITFVYKEMAGQSGGGWGRAASS